MNTTARGGSLSTSWGNLGGVPKGSCNLAILSSYFVRAWRVESTGQRLDPSAEHPRRHLLAVQCRETRTGRKLLNGLTLPVCVLERGQEHERGETYYPLFSFLLNKLLTIREKLLPYSNQQNQKEKTNEKTNIITTS